MTFHSRNSKDPLSVLPLEILISIFQELSSGDRISCLGACRAWRDWMLKAPMVWINVEVSRSQANVIFNLLPRVGRHIENLELNWDANRFMTPIARGVFKNLKSLHVLGVKAPRGSYLEHDLCLKAFRKVDFKLTPKPPTFTQIHLACPKLVKFGYHAKYFVRENVPANNNIETDKLVELSIGANKAALLGMDLEAILPRYSNIKKLTVTKFPYQYIFNYIPRLCPNLESFTFHRNKDGCHQDHRFPVTLPIRPTLPMFQGKLHTLILMEDDFATPMPWDMMKNILEQASPTLQQLHCCFYFTNTRFTSILGADPPRFNLPELKILKCTVGEGKSQKYVASLICNAPKLAAVTIRNYARTQRIADQILDALIGLDHLTWLELLESRFSKQLNEKKLISLFDKHAALGDKAPLQCVSLDGPFVKRDILAPLTKVVTLRGIDLGFCNPNLNKFIVAVKKLKHFHDLRVMKMGTVTNDTLLKFASIPNLKRFILLACKNVNSNGLFKLVDNSLSLEELQISEGTNRSSKFEVHAKEKLAKFCIYSNFDDDNFV